MKEIRISDATMKETARSLRLSFKEKIELSKLLDKLGVDFIELDSVKNEHVDLLLIKSIASAVLSSGISVTVDLNAESVNKTWEALRYAKHPRLQVLAPASAVQIEYLYKKKPDAMLNSVKETVAAASALCQDVEFVAADATRAEPEFLAELVGAAIAAGASTVTFSDCAGTMLPDEFKSFIRRRYEEIPALSCVKVGVFSANTISMADASVIASISEGANQISVAAYPVNSASLECVMRVLSAKGDALGVSSKVNTTKISRIIEQINWVCRPGKDKTATAYSNYQGEDDIFLTSHDDLGAVSEAAAKLGYDLSEDDAEKVFLAFSQIVSRKDRVSLKELDAIVASSAMQVPPTYVLDNYVVTSGNSISATAHIKLLKNGTPLEGVFIGNGPIDKITGCSYELDDYQLQAVTEGREAMGQTVVKLRAGGKLYSGRGISTDIVGAGIQAYLSALNKIIYEEEVE